MYNPTYRRISFAISFPLLYSSKKKRTLADSESTNSMASPPPPHDGCHDDNYYGGICDYASAFRSAINDVYNSVPGITLYDVAGRHGWGLSRRKHDQPQASKQTISEVALICLCPPLM